MFKVLRSVADNSNFLKKKLLTLSKMNKVPFTTITPDNITNFSDFGWMESEEKMKKHLNVIDWKDNAAEKIRGKIKKENKDQYDLLNKRKNYSENLIYADVQKLKEELNKLKQSGKLKDYEDPAHIHKVKKKGATHYATHRGLCSSDVIFLTLKFYFSLII